MGLRENLLEKIQINQLADSVIRSIHPTDSARRIDLDAMRQLLNKGPYRHREERDLDLYLLNDQHILALDNELKIYNSSIEDVGLRKSPTVKEMISIRNAIKILNDKDVVVSRKNDTVARIHKELLQNLDLSYDAADIESMAEDGRNALHNKYTDGIDEILTLFAELLGFQKANKIFRVPHHHIWGKTMASPQGDIRFGPVVIHNLMLNSLKMIQTPINSANQKTMQQFHDMVKGKIDADLANEEVIEALKQAVLDKPNPQ
jgi:hypothetical protein